MWSNPQDTSNIETSADLVKVTNEFMFCASFLH